MDIRRLAAAAIAAVAASVWADPLTGTVRDADGKAPSDYVPAMLSNGRLNVFADYRLGIADDTKALQKKRLTPGIWWEGRRLGDNDGVASKHGFRLLEHGAFKTVLLVDGKPAGEPKRWEQRLDLRQALTSVENDFGGGVRLAGEMFVPQARNAIAVRQTVTSADADHEISLGLVYVAPTNERLVGKWTAEDAGALWRMRCYARFVTDEDVRIVPDGFSPTVTFEDRSAKLLSTFRLGRGESRTLDWFVTFTDNLGDKLPRVTPAPEPKGPIGSYAAVRAAHLADWAAFFGESSIEVPDARIRLLSDMARYHLRCVSTEWSIPVGIIQSHWQGKIFGFDEMYAMQGLLSAGHFTAAKVAPEFRYATLNLACSRVNKDIQHPFCKYGARWMWEGVEGNVVEGSPIGYYYDHIFGQAAIAQTVWSYYRYVDDLAWLKEKGYPVIRECALFFRRLCVQDMPDGTSFVTKCTDLERLGPGHERAFMTTCGVITTLRAAAEAARLVGATDGFAPDFLACAERLVASLPVADGRYVAYPGCTDESMGTLAGFYPFRTFDRSNAAQVKAVAHFLENGQAFGNMYSTGKRICPWYAATMAMAALRAGNTDYPPVRWLEEAFRSGGVWGEYWEINEPGVSEYRPWFMTAAGNCLYAINQLFVADMEGAVHLAAGVPADWKDYAFRLPVPGGVTVDMAVKGGQLARLGLKVKNPAAGRRERFVLPATLGGRTFDVVLDKAEIAVH